MENAGRERQVMAMIELQCVYTTNWAQQDDRRRHSFRSVTSSWSSINQIAFTSDGSAASSETGNKRSGNQSFIHIIDPNKPWDIYSIVSDHAETITDLQWHPSGCHLLSADRSGVFKIWSMKNNLVNDWYCERTIDIGEKPICFSWLGTSAKFLFCDVPKDHLMNPATSQTSFSRNKVKHPLASFCGTSRDGWLAVTETGKVCFASMNPEVDVVKIQIDTDLQGVQAGDIAFSNDQDVDRSVEHGRKQVPNGCVILGLADSLVGSVARFYKVSLHCTSNASVSIKCSTLQTLSPISNTSSFPYAITYIKFVYRNSGGHVLICNEGLLESCIERWHLKKELPQLHELCQKQQPHKKPHPIKKWVCYSKHSVRKHISSLAVPWLPVDPDNVESCVYPRHNLLLGFADGHLRALNSLTLEIEGELKSFTHLSELSHKPKRLKTSFCGHSDAFLSLHYSPCSCCVLGISGSGTMYLLKCQPTNAINHVQVPMAMVNLLEYCLMSGWDWWDVLVTLKHQREDILEATLRQFEQDNKNLPHTQINSKYLSIKAGLLSLNACSDTKVTDCYSKQFLLAVSNFFKSLIPSGDDRLTGFCQQVTVEIDFENLHQSLDLREFEVDSAILRTLHPLAQWLADCCVSLLGILLVQQGQQIMPGVSLLQDSQCILLLKQLVLLVLIWAKQFPGILPNCVAPVEKQEYLIHLFKLIAKLWMVNQKALEFRELEGAAKDLEPFFCNHLNFLYQSLVLSSSNQGVTGTHTYSKPGEWDAHVFGEKPRDRMLPLKLLTTQCSGDIDVVRKLFLGNISHERLRQCTKCEGVSLLAQVSDGHPENAWEQRWVKSCMCGGAWKRLRDS